MHYVHAQVEELRAALRAKEAALQEAQRNSGHGGGNFSARQATRVRDERIPRLSAGSSSTLAPRRSGTEARSLHHWPSPSLLRKQGSMPSKLTRNKSEPRELNAARKDLSTLASGAAASADAGKEAEDPSAEGLSA